MTIPCRRDVPFLLFLALLLLLFNRLVLFLIRFFGKVTAEISTLSFPVNERRQSFAVRYTT